MNEEITAERIVQILGYKMAQMELQNSVLTTKLQEALKKIEELSGKVGSKGDEP